MAFEDAGARKTMIFTDHGVVTTTSRTGPALTAQCSRSLRGQADVSCSSSAMTARHYGVDAILDCEDIRKVLTGVVLSANDRWPHGAA